MKNQPQKVILTVKQFQLIHTYFDALMPSVMLPWEEALSKARASNDIELIEPIDSDHDEVK